MKNEPVQSKPLRSEKIYLIATSPFRYLATEVCQAQPEVFEEVQLDVSVFPNGEQRLEILNFSAIAERDVVLIGGTEREELFELLLCAGELSKTCSRLNIWIPFFRYSTQEKKDKGKDGHIVLAQGIAQVLSCLPEAKNGNRIILVDPHTEKLSSYFDSSRIEVHAISCTPLLAEIVDLEVPGQRIDKVVCSVDDGRPEAVLKISELLGIPSALVAKERISGSETRVVGAVRGDVRNKIAIMVDDMGRTLGSAAGAAQAYLNAGAREVWLVVTHADYSLEALPRLQKKGAVRGVLSTDTYHRHSLADGDYSRVVSAATFLAQELISRL